MSHHSLLKKCNIFIIHALTLFSLLLTFSQAHAATRPSLQSLTNELEMQEKMMIGFQAELERISDRYMGSYIALDTGWQEKNNTNLFEINHGQASVGCDQLRCGVHLQLKKVNESLVIGGPIHFNYAIDSCQANWALGSDSRHIQFIGPSDSCASNLSEYRIIVEVFTTTPIN